MEKFKSEEKGHTENRPLTVTGQLEMPSEILPWERNLLAVLLEAIDGAEQREEKVDSEVSS